MTFDTFIIQFEGLKLGKHNYHFLVDDAFFQGLDYSEIQRGKVLIDAVMEKNDRFLKFQFHFKGSVYVPCDRCGEDFEAYVDTEEDLIVRPGDEPDVDDGMIVIDKNAFDFDITHYLYETINLSLPVRRVHPEKKGAPTCDPELLKYLYGDQDDDSDDDGPIDPRWEALKKLK